MAIGPQRVLLTGGAGFIGSHLAQALLRRGVKLTIVDNLDEFYPVAWKRANLDEILRTGPFEFLPIDICDFEALALSIVKSPPDAIVHLAARAGVRPSIEQPLLYERVNVQGTANLLQICRELKIPKFIFGSSSSVYGTTSKAPFSEDHIEGKPISPYAATKLSGELLCYTYAHLFGFAAICLRFFTVYGPRQRPDLAIHKFTALIEAGKPVPIFGDGSTGRDYTFVDDIVAGILAAISFEPELSGGARYEIFNLGNSHPVRLCELVELIEAVTGRRAPRSQQPAQAGDVPLTWADISKARSLLGYHPQTDIRDGIERFVAWYRRFRSQ